MFKLRRSHRQQAPTRAAQTISPAVEPPKAAAIPEASTAAWKQRVEAEARRRLKSELHGAGAPRR